jgi:CDP-diglyceride synthetase
MAKFGKIGFGKGGAIGGLISAILVFIIIAFIVKSIFWAIAAVFAIIIGGYAVSYFKKQLEAQQQQQKTS